MDVVIIGASPNEDGLTAACASAAAEGVRAAGGQVERIRLNDLQVGLCQACNDGWGTCRADHVCQVADDFQALHERVCRADGLVLVSPVYFGELSESAKAFADRIRRCEATRGEQSNLAGKPVIAVGAAGGGGGGTVTCLSSMDRWIKHVRARMFDLISVTRWGRAYKLVAIREAARAMVLGIER